MPLSILTALCNRQHYPFTELFHHSKTVALHPLNSTPNPDFHPVPSEHCSVWFLVFVFLGPHPRHMEVPRLGGLIGAVAAGLHHSHANAGSKLCLQPTPQLRVMPDI